MKTSPRKNEDIMEVCGEKNIHNEADGIQSKLWMKKP
jgi:hypothetical protein